MWASGGGEGYRISVGPQRQRALAARALQRAARLIGVRRERLAAKQSCAGARRGAGEVWASGGGEGYRISVRARRQRALAARALQHYGNEVWLITGLRVLLAAHSGL